MASLTIGPGIAHAALSQAIPFVHPSLAAVALGLGLIPLLIHLLNRRRFVRMPWAAMSFLLAANRRSARRVRIEQWLLLATRMLVVVLLGLAVARPYFPASRLLPLRESRMHRVILLDDSLSMNMKTANGGTRFDRARDYAESLLNSFPEQDAMSLVTLSEPATAVLAQAAFDRRFVREQLAAISPTQRGTDPVGGLRQAEEILRSGKFPPGNRAVYLISDMPASDWGVSPRASAPPAIAAIRRLTAEEGQVDVVLIRIGEEEPANTAITELRLDSALTGVLLPLRVTADLRHFGSTARRDVTVQFRVDGQTVRRQEIPRVAPGVVTPVTMTTEFRTPGTHLIEARLVLREADALAEDDARYLSVEARQSRPVLLVDGRPGASLLNRQTGFLEKAMAPRVAGDEPVLLAPHVIGESELAHEAFTDFDVIVLCNVPGLTEATWRRLEAFVREGGGLAVFGGDLVNAESYNGFGYAEGQGLLPAAFEDRDPNREAAGGVGVKLEALSHEIAAEFKDHAEGGLFTARIQRYLPVKVDSRRGETVLSYTNGDPMLVAGSFGKGRVLLCTTTANLDWSNLPAKGDFVALVLKSMAYLSPARGAERNVNVGGEIREPLTAAEWGWPLRVVNEHGATVEPSVLPDGGRLVLRYGPVERGGVVTASVGNDQRVFAVNVRAAESDPACAAAEALREAFGGAVRVVAEARNGNDKTVSPKTQELGPPLLYLVLVLLLMEMWLAMSFGSQRMEGRSAAYRAPRGRPAA